MSDIASADWCICPNMGVDEECVVHGKVWRPLVAQAQTNMSLSELATLAARHGYSLVPDEPNVAICFAAADASRKYSDEHRPAWAEIYRAMVQTGRVRPG